MGNASTKERAASPSHRAGGPSRSGGRHHPDNAAAIFGFRETRERDREAERQARDLRRQERERERQKEKERSLREESVDGGFVVTHGVYTGTEDFKDRIVRQFIIERRLAPFFKGLRDHDENWTDAQLYAAVNDLPIPGPDAEPPKEEILAVTAKKAFASSDNLTVPIASRSRSHSYTSDASGGSSASSPAFGFSSTRNRARTLSISHPRNPTLPNTAGPAETNIPSRFVDGRPLEAVLYEHAAECPICFLYYPPFLNKTRCCDQEICSECFVQIKRSDPHIPESHSDPPPNNPELATSVADQLVSEPATCPFCKQPEFGITYSPPPFRRGLVFTSDPYLHLSNGNANGSSLSLGGSPPSSHPSSPPLSPTGRRKFIVPLSAPEVVTTDQIRPDWSQKLQSARSHAARRAAAATALHTAAFLMNGPSTSTTTSSSYSRRLMRRAREGSSADRESESPSPNHSGSGTPRDDLPFRGSLLGLGGSRTTPPLVEDRLASLGFISPRESSRNAPTTATGDRRSRMVDLEEMMLMEAIRLSLVEEEERKRKEAEEAKNKGKAPENSNGGENTDPAESMFNFRSLAEMITDEDKVQERAEHVETTATRSGE